MWINQLKIEDSIRSIQKEMRNGGILVLDPLRFDDLSSVSVRDKLRKEILTILKTKKYKVENLSEIEVPKAKYILRPGARPILIDWIIYDAVVSYIARKIYTKVPKVSFSFQKFRDRMKNKKEYKNINYWVAFDDEALSRAKKNSFMLVTDITGFFEHISIDALKERLLLLSTDSEYQRAVSFLVDLMLEVWTKNNSIGKFGLPQGVEASRILADIYLYSVDQVMTKTKSNFIRWMDDMILFASTESQLKISMIELQKVLRDLKLSINSKKTVMYEIPKKGSFDFYFDSEKQLLSDIEEGIHNYSYSSKKIKQIQKGLARIKSLAFKPNINFSDRYLRFYISHTIDLMKRGLISKALVQRNVMNFLFLFEKKPDFTGKFCWFFLMAVHYDNKLKRVIIKKLIEFICNKKENVYAWQEMWALDTIRQLGPLDKRTVKRLKDNIRIEHNACLAQYMVIAGQANSYEEKEEILKRADYKGDLYRSALLATQDIKKEIVQKYIKAPEYFEEYLDKLSGKHYGYFDKLNKVKILPKVTVIPRKKPTEEIRESIYE